MATAGATEEDRRLVLDQLAAAVRENRWTFDQARPVLLAAVGGKPSDAAAVWSHAGQDCGPILSSGVGEPPTERISVTREAQTGKVSQVSVERGQVSSLGSLRGRKTDPSGGPLKHGELQTRLTVASSGGQVYITGRAGSR